MNSKKNSFKRVAASALAVLTVAAYAAPVANVGGIPAKLLVAEAADPTSDFNCHGLEDAIISVSDGVLPKYETATISAYNGIVKLTQGKTVSIQSSVPLVFNKKGNVDVADQTGLYYDATNSKVYKIKAGYKQVTIGGELKVVSTTEDAVDEFSVTPDPANYVKVGENYYAVATEDTATEDFTEQDANHAIAKIGDADSDDKYFEKAQTGATFANDTYYKINQGTATLIANESEFVIAESYKIVDFPDDVFIINHKAKKCKAEYGRTSGTTVQYYSTQNSKTAADFTSNANTGHCMLNGENYVTDYAGIYTGKTYTYVDNNYTNDTYYTETTYSYDATNNKFYQADADITLTKTADSLTEVSSNGVYTYTFTMPASTVAATGKKTGVIITTDGKLYKSTGKYELVAEGAEGYTKEVQIDEAALPTVHKVTYGATGSATELNYYDLLTNKKVKFSADDPFKLVTWSGNTADLTAPIKATYVDGKYVAEYTVPEYTEGAQNQYTRPQVAIIKASGAVTLTKSTDGTSLVANGESAENVIAAAISASYVKVDEKTNLPETIKIPSNGKVENGTTVTLNIDTLHKFLSTNAKNDYYTISVTKDGAEVLKKDQADKTIQCDNTHESSNYTFNKAGKYKADVDVYQLSTDGATYKVFNLSYTFEIASLADLTAENVKLEASSTKDGILKGATANKITKYGVTDGVVEFEVTENFKDGDVVSVDPSLFIYNKETKKEDAFLGNVTATGSLSASSVDEVQTVTIKYSNDEYATSTPITIKWKLIEAAKVPAMEWADGIEKVGTSAVLNTSVDEIANLKANILDLVVLKNIAEKDVEFEYIEGLNASLEDDELDEHFTGLPKAEGTYSVFLRYKGESMKLVKLTIKNHSAYVVPAESALTVDFGDVKTNNLADPGTFKLKDYTVQNAAGEKIKVTFEDIEVAVRKPVFDAKGNLTYHTENGKETTRYETTNFVGIADKANIKNKWNDSKDLTKIDNTYFLKPGTYILEVQGKNPSSKDYAADVKQFVFTVNAKQITSDMVLIDPVEYTGSAVEPVVDTANITNPDKQKKVIHAVAKYPGLEINVGGGTTSASAVGDYKIKIVSANDDYKGSASVAWHIVKATTSSELSTLKWDEKATAIYDNGRIHVEVNRPADDAFTGKISRYGVIIEKSGKLAAPEIVNGKYVTAGDAYDAAKKALVVGNGFREGNQSDTQKNKTPLIYGANIRVNDVETSIWVRPYIELDNGQIYYGKVKCLNLIQEATEKLNLKMADTGAKVGAVEEAAITKDTAYKNAGSNADKLEKRKGINCGYNDKTGKFYVYGSYTIPEKSENSATAVTTFGVIVDKTGKNAAPVDPDAITEAEIKAVSDKLLVGEGYIEGHADPNSKTMEGDEYGANIKPKDSVTGVWVRAYVNLGRGVDDNGKPLDKDTIVYTDPIYILPVSEQYSAQKPAFTAGAGKTGTKASGQAHLAFTAAAAPTGATIKQAGVVVDKTGSLYTHDDTTGKDILNPDASAKLLIGENYTVGKKTDFSNGMTYGANATPKAGKFIVARTYVIYTINGVDVTLYGDVKLINEAQGTWKN